MNYHYLVASDMDYTLLVTGTEVSEENRKAIRELREAGVAFTLATGRTFYLVGKYVRELDIDVPLITSNGAALYDPFSHSEVYSNNMDEKVLKELFKILLDRKVDFAGYSPSGVYFAPNSGRRAFFGNYNKDVPEEEKAKLYDFDYGTLDKADFPIFNKILVVGADEETTKLLRSRPDLETAASTGNFLDVMKVGSTKGNGLMMLADRLGIPRENTFAIGDNENDLPMLQMAAHSIAMGNSREDIKACCDYVTSNCDEDGFAKAMREYVLPMVKKDRMLP